MIRVLPSSCYLPSNFNASYLTTSTPPGTYTDVPGMPACVPCAPGQYAASQGSTSCIACAAGKVAAWRADIAYQTWNGTQLGYATVRRARGIGAPRWQLWRRLIALHQTVEGGGHRESSDRDVLTHILPQGPAPNPWTIPPSPCSRPPAWNVLSVTASPCPAAPPACPAPLGTSQETVSAGGWRYSAALFPGEWNWKGAGANESGERVKGKRGGE